MPVTNARLVGDVPIGTVKVSAISVTVVGLGERPCLVATAAGFFRFADGTHDEQFVLVDAVRRKPERAVCLVRILGQMTLHASMIFLPMGAGIFDVNVNRLMHPGASQLDAVLPFFALLATNAAIRGHRTLHRNVTASVPVVGADLSGEHALRDEASFSICLQRHLQLVEQLRLRRVGPSCQS